MDHETVIILKGVLRLWTMIGLMIHTWLKEMEVRTRADLIAFILIGGPVCWLAKLLLWDLQIDKHWAVKTLRILVGLVTLVWLTRYMVI